MSDKIKVTLSPAALEVNAGESVELTATIQNRSEVVDQFTIALEGLAPNWYGFSVASVSLFPGDKDQIKVTIHPPKTAETKAGSYPFTVKAISGADPEKSTGAEASVEVHTFAGLTADMSPTRLVGQSGAYVITLNNQGNAEVTQSFEASDPEEGLDYTFKPEEVTVPAGGSATVELVAKLKKKPKIDGEKEYPFQVVVKPSGADRFSPEAKTLNGQLVYERKTRPKPKIPRWLIAVLVGVAVAIIVILLLRGCSGPPEIVDFAFNYTATEEGYELHWVIENAAEGDINKVALKETQLKEGVMSVNPCDTGETVYVLTARKGASAVNATVVIPPCLSFDADWLGCEFRLSWTTKGADQVYLNGVNASAEREWTEYRHEPTEYNLTAENDGGKVEKTIAMAPATVTVTSPKGGDDWCPRSSEDITWEITEPQKDGSSVTARIDHVGLEYSIDEGDWHPIATIETNDRSYSWKLPSTTSTAYKVRVTLYCSEDKILAQGESDIFTIASGCKATLMMPYLPDGYVLAGDKLTVSWWISEDACTHHARLYYNIGDGWVAITGDLPCVVQEYPWTVSCIVKEAAILAIITPEIVECRLRIVIFDSANQILCDDASDAFMIWCGELG